MKLALSTPSCRDWKASFGASLCGLVRHLTLKGYDIDMNIMQGTSVLPKGRQKAVDWAKSINATHLLCIDDDMAFPCDILDGFDFDLDIQACNYVTKGTCKPLVHFLDGTPVHSKDRLGTEEVGWVGFGFILIKLDSIKDIPAPLFEMRWMEDRKDFIGEDFYFCMKAQSHGAKIYVNHDASNKMKHIGDFAYGEAA